MTLYHGSVSIVGTPLFGYGRKDNDYGQGFYCTEDIELAREWSCQDPSGGFLNTYDLDIESLRVLELDKSNVLSWLAILLSNRSIRYSNPIERSIGEYIIKNFTPNIKGYDLIKGYRADDSYFSIARMFISNTISLEQLGYAMQLGQLGIQICLKSKKSFEVIRFEGADPVEGSLYYPKRLTRDNSARALFNKLLEENVKEGIFARDIINKEMTENELRL